MYEVIIYGAGNRGKEAFYMLRAIKSVNICYWLDNDENKRGKYYFGRIIKHLSEFRDNDKNKFILVACNNGYEEAMRLLKQLGCNNVWWIGAFAHQYNIEAALLYADLNQNRCIDLRKLIKGYGEVKLNSLSFDYFSSGVMDYALLRILADKYNVKKYLEIGTYIGDSLHIIADIVEELYSITAEIGSIDSMEDYCWRYHVPDYSDSLTTDKNIVHFYSDSKEFDFNQIEKNIDMYFIDADHSYNGVYCDTKSIFMHKNKDSIVVWHDFQQMNRGYDHIIVAVNDAIGEEEFQNVYITDGNICGIYLPRGIQKDFKLIKRAFSDVEHCKLKYGYNVKMNIVNLEE